jgi:hypothetical protein
VPTVEQALATLALLPHRQDTARQVS